MKRVLLMLTLSLAVVASGAEDLFKQLGVTRSDASKEVIASFVSGAVPAASLRTAVKPLSGTARAAVVTQVLDWTKSYVSSPQFDKDYASYRSDQKPAPVAEASAIDALQRDRREQRRVDMEEARKGIADLPAGERKTAEDALQDAAKQLAELENSTDFLKNERDGIDAEFREAKEKYDDDLRQWQSAYPANPRGLIVQRLREFLAASESVDFDAKLVAKGGRMRFVEQKYEHSPEEWKLCYRAGRETTDVARTFARNWLAELTR